MKRTINEIHYKGTPCTKGFIIPAHTPVEEATNLPDDGKYWAKPWKQILDDEADSWMRNCGFLINEDEVEEAPEGADIAYLGSFILLDDDEPVVVHDYDIRLITEEEAEKMISSKENGYDSYVLPSECETVDYTELTEVARSHNSIDCNEIIECLPDMAYPERTEDGYWINVRLFVPSP